MLSRYFHDVGLREDLVVVLEVIPAELERGLFSLLPGPHAQGRRGAATFWNIMTVRKRCVDMNVRRVQEDDTQFHSELKARGGFLSGVVPSIIH